MHEEKIWQHENQQENADFWAKNAVQHLSDDFEDSRQTKKEYDELGHF